MSYWPSTLVDRKLSSDPTSAPVMRLPIAVVIALVTALGVRWRRLCAAPTAGARTVRNASTLA